MRAHDVGLSPPTRGSRCPGPRRRYRRRSIPAHTGKPVQLADAVGGYEVYPRPHGEAPERLDGRYGLGGLSPPTRGSRSSIRRFKSAIGSIPAHTGKPGRGAQLSPDAGVYPRPHGEARPTSGFSTVRRGLSPPTRGSPWIARELPAVERSIPAHTGKPAAAEKRVCRARVYPRPHGEALEIHDGLEREPGLSPPTRGSPKRRARRAIGLRSIPAHTGKPISCLDILVRERVYPRPHGEASGRP